MREGDVLWFCENKLWELCFYLFSVVVGKLYPEIAAILGDAFTKFYCGKLSNLGRKEK